MTGTSEHTRTLYTVLEELRKAALSNRERGDLFERLIRSYLRTDPMYADRYDHVWLWGEWPAHVGADTGIDLVAEVAGGGLCAIQCKFYEPHHRLMKEDLDSFFTASGKIGFTERLIVSTTDNWSKNAEAALADQSIPVSRISLHDLAESRIDWAAVSPLQPPEILPLAPRKDLRPHQLEALDDVIAGFADNDRGKLIMACGTGKTYTALRVAEEIAATVADRPARILFLVPSISLLSQTLREWAADASVPLAPFAVCSDTKVGRDDEDLSRHELAFPATTDPAKLHAQVAASHRPDGMTVVFSTYQSLPVVSKAQAMGLESFDLIICDEAHRTTGSTAAGTEDSNFVLVHQNDFIAATKRLYMTATPRMFSPAARAKAEREEIILWSMNDEEVFGPEFHRLGFGEAVERDLLTDYKVIVLAVDEQYVSAAFQGQFEQNGELKLEDAVKLVGCWNGLSRRERDAEGKVVISGPPLRRAVAFSRSIAASKKITQMFEDVSDLVVAPDDPDPVYVEAEHVDGTFNSLKRNEKLAWLKSPFEPDDNTCRVLSNARCLSEGVDVPNLDAVLFLSARKSQVDVVQSVGRVMRKSEGKDYGYIILPVGIPTNLSPEEALADNRNYEVVWEVLQALRAHDDRFNAIINKLDLNQTAPDQLSVIGLPGMGDSDAAQQHMQQLAMSFPHIEEWRNAIYARIVQKCGDRLYWEDWARSIAQIADAHVARISALLANPDTAVSEQFQSFLAGLQANLNDSITEANAVEMLAQHIITKPVFDALFQDYEFAEHNPVSIVMQAMLDALSEHNLQSENEELESFYASVRKRAEGIDNATAKQRIITELYERFFKLAFPKAADSLGIVYTPIQIVDFILRSVEQILTHEFDASLNDDGVHVLDPFTGTGTFIVRLVQSGLITASQLAAKYAGELHANEINLLAYYIAAVNIEAAFHDLVGGAYQPFEGIVLTDTFQMHESDGKLEHQMFAANSERVAKQKKADIRVIVGNPPYSTGQTSGNDDNQNLKYPRLDKRLEGTYVARTTARNANSLYDSYIRAFRWASDRIGDRGVVAFVSNGGFIDSNTADGMRKTLVDEFDSIYVYNLRGNQRTSGELSRKEGGKIFGGGSRATIAITFLVKTGDRGEGVPARIYYRDIGDYLTREQKLDIIEYGRVEDLTWSLIEPNEHGDWINQRRGDFQQLYPVYQDAGDRIFTLASRGLATGRDAWIYNSSKALLAANVDRAIEFYNSEVERLADSNDTPNLDPKRFSWNRADRTNLRNGVKYHVDPDRFYVAQYRPFFRQHAYFERSLNDMVYRQHKIFPTPETENYGIYCVGKGSAVPFSVLMVDRLPDLHVTGAGSGGQFFPRYTYYEAEGLFSENPETAYERVDNITDKALEAFRARYGEQVTKDDIFYYTYAVLHSPDYRAAYEADLRKLLPNIPMADDFAALTAAGRTLADLHLGYETAEPYGLEEIIDPVITASEDEFDAYRVAKLQYGAGARVNGKKEPDRSRIVVNHRITLAGIPDEAHDYMIGTRSALDWLLDRYKVSPNQDSGITNDPNDWTREQDAPNYIVELIKRVVTVSVRTVEITGGLPTVL